MAEIVVRPYEEKDEEGFFLVRAMTYNSGLPVPPEQRTNRFYRPFVAEFEGAIVGVYRLLDFTCTRGLTLLRNGGVAGVAVLPELRRAGVGAAMMRHAIRQMREDGVHLSSLYAFRESWYRKFGWEVVGKRLEIVCPTHRLPKVTSGLGVRRLGPEDWETIQPCFETWAQERSGASLRTPLLWDRFLNEHRPNAVYAFGDPVEGYLAVSHKVDFWVEQRLTEVCWSTPRGYLGCLEMMQQLGINKSAIVWFEPSDGPFYARFMDEGVSVSVARQIMFRANDVPGSLRSLRTDQTGEFCIEVADEVVQDNRGPWKVRFSSEGVDVEAGGEPDFRIDIRPFSQALLGDPSLRDLLAMGAVEVLRPQGVEEAARLLSPMAVYCGEFF